MSARVLSRGAAWLAESFPAYAAHIAERVAEANSDFSSDYIHKLVQAWADVTSLRTTGAPFQVTEDMDEVTVAALSLPRTYISFISTVCGVARLDLTAPERYETPADLARTRQALIAAGYGADPEVWGTD